VRRKPPSKLEFASIDAGSCNVRRGFSGKSASAANLCIPAHRRELSCSSSGPRRMAIFRCPRLWRCSNGGIAAGLVVGYDGLNRTSSQVAPYDRDGNTVFLDLGERIDLCEEPVGDQDQPFDAASDEHVEIAVKLLRAIVRVHDDGQERAWGRGRARCRARATCSRGRRCRRRGRRWSGCGGG
jgi:hypothetical protein